MSKVLGTDNVEILLRGSVEGRAVAFANRINRPSLSLTKLKASENARMMYLKF